MLFQTLDDKQECVGLFVDNELYFNLDEVPSGLSKTWKYVPYLRGSPGIEYASLYLGGKRLGDVIPEFLQNDWEDVTSRLQAFKRSLTLAQVNTHENCFYDLVPQRFLVEYCRVKNTITDYVLTHLSRPPRYDFTFSVCQMLEGIAHQKMKINHRRLLSYLASSPSNLQLKRLEGGSPYIRYNQFGTRTGRLTTTPGSFPLLTLKKEFRSIVEPHNDYFIELDFNGAEARVMMGILGIDQPSEDIHSFHQRSVFDPGTTRDEAKTAFFAWLYGSRSSDSIRLGKKLESFYDKGKILEKYWNGVKVNTPLGKSINNVDEHHALNYIIQSTAAELTLLQALKIDFLLRQEKCKSSISFLIHDAVVLDFHSDDEHLLPAIEKLMSSTKLGKFKINISKGKNLGSLKKRED